MSLRLPVRLNVAARLADEGPRDDAADAERIAELSADLADLVEPLEPEMLFVRADLKHGIGGGVADRLAGPDVLLAELLDDSVPEACCCRECRAASPRAISAVGQVLREGRDGVREIAPGERHRQAGELPMAGLRVLALRDFARIGPDRRRLFDALDALRMRAGRGFGGAADAEAVHHRDFERPGAEARLVGRAGGAGGGDVAERVGALVAEFRGVRARRRCRRNP